MTDDLDVKTAIQDGDCCRLARLSSIGSLAGERARSLGKQQLRAHASTSLRLMLIALRAPYAHKVIGQQVACLVPVPSV
jgi:hypothetical protein